MELRASVRAGLVGHARAAAPAEACGLLGGRAGAEATVTVAIPAPNVADRPRHRYVLDPEALIAGQEALEADGWDLLGFFDLLHALKGVESYHGISASRC